MKLLNRAYQTKGCWNTWGSMSGKFSEEQAPLPSNILDHSKPLVRKNIPWSFAHPRTFKAFLFSHFKASDFQDEKGKWLRKVSDRGFIYNYLELSGADRSCFLTDVLYTYVWGATVPSAKTVSHKVAKRLIAYIQNLPPLTMLDKAEGPVCPAS